MVSIIYNPTGITLFSKVFDKFCENINDGLSSDLIGGFISALKKFSQEFGQNEIKQIEMSTLKFLIYEKEGIMIFFLLDHNECYKMSTWSKLKTGILTMKNFGPKEEFGTKKYIIIMTSTIPFKHLKGDVFNTLKSMKIYITKLIGKLVDKLIYTDTLFKFKKKKEAKMMDKAYKIGKSLRNNIHSQSKSVEGR